MSLPVPYTLEITATTSYAYVNSGTFLSFQGTITAKSTNAGTISLQDQYGNVTTLIAGEWFPVQFCNLAALQVLGSISSQVVKFQGVVSP